MITDYQQQDIDALKKRYAKICDISDNDLKDFYRYWSEQTFCAGWIQSSDGIYEDFYQWLFYSPFERKLKEMYTND